MKKLTRLIAHGLAVALCSTCVMAQTTPSNDQQGNPLANAVHGFFQKIQSASEQLRSPGMVNDTPSSDPATWNVLGVKIGDSAATAYQKILASFPKAAKLDGIMKPKIGNFYIGDTVTTGTTIFDGDFSYQVNSVEGNIGPMIHAQCPNLSGGSCFGADNLGSGSSEHDVLGYVWPSDGSVVLISRTHKYGYSTNGIIPPGVPTITAIRAALVSKFGKPSMENVVRGIGADKLSTPGALPQFQINLSGSKYAGPPGDTWIWSAHATVNLRTPEVLEACEARIEAATRIATSGPSAFGESSLALGNGNPQCGTMLIVSAKTTISDDFPAELTEVLFDDPAFEQASVRFRGHLQELEDAARAKAKKEGNSSKVVL